MPSVYVTLWCPCLVLPCLSYFPKIPQPPLLTRRLCCSWGWCETRPSPPSCGSLPWLPWCPGVPARGSGMNSHPSPGVPRPSRSRPSSTPHWKALPGCRERIPNSELGASVEAVMRCKKFYCRIIFFWRERKIFSNSEEIILQSINFGVVRELLYQL